MWLEPREAKLQKRLSRSSEKIGSFACTDRSQPMELEGNGVRSVIAGKNSLSLKGSGSPGNSGGF